MPSESNTKGKAKGFVLSAYFSVKLSFRLRRTENKLGKKSTSVMLNSNYQLVTFLDQVFYDQESLNFFFEKYKILTNSFLKICQNFDAYANLLSALEQFQDI